MNQKLLICLKREKKQSFGLENYMFVIEMNFLREFLKKNYHMNVDKDYSERQVNRLAFCDSYHFLP